MTKQELEATLVGLLQKQVEKPKPKLEFIKPETKEPLIIPQKSSTLEQEIEQIKNKHKMLYGE